MNVKNCWLLRPLPHGNNRMRVFLEEDIIAIGYPVGKSFQGMSYDEIREALGKWSEGLGNVNIFVNSMKKGDVVIVPDDNKRDIYIGYVDGDYRYEPELEIEGYPHLRDIIWLFDKKPLFRNVLPDRIRGSLRYPGTVADLTKHLDIVEKLINNRLPQDKSNSNKNLSAEKEAMEVLQSLLRSEKEEIRLKAAEVILMSQKY